MEASEMQERKRKGLYIATLAENFGKTLSDLLTMIWLEALSPYTCAEVEVAVKKIINSYKYKTLPPLAIFKQELNALRGQISEIESSDLIDARAVAEWNTLCESLTKFSPEKKPPLHPATEFALRSMGGWVAAGMWTTAELSFRRNEFLKIWKLAQGRENEMALGSDFIQPRQALQEPVKKRPVGVAVNRLMQTMSAQNISALSAR